MRNPFGPRYPVCRTVIVNTKSNGPTFRGVLWARRRQYLLLKDAEILRGRSDRMAVDGDVLVPMGNVEFLQVL